MPQKQTHRRSNSASSAAFTKRNPAALTGAGFFIGVMFAIIKLMLAAQGLPFYGCTLHHGAPQPTPQP